VLSPFAPSKHQTWFGLWLELSVSSLAQLWPTSTHVVPAPERKKRGSALGSSLPRHSLCPGFFASAASAVRSTADAASTTPAERRFVIAQTP
jgi:hypothetical protein